MTVAPASHGRGMSETEVEVVQAPIPVAEPRSIAGTFLGGFVPAVAYHFGVLEILEERGFVFRAGFRGANEPRVTGPRGSTLWSVPLRVLFVTAACAGLKPDNLVGDVTEESSAKVASRRTTSVRARD